MEFSISKKNALRILAQVNSVINKKSAVPLLAAVLITLDDKTGTVSFVATDLSVTFSVSIKTTLDQSGSFSLGAREIFSIVRELQDGDLTISVDEKYEVRVTQGKAQYKLDGGAATGFPALLVPSQTDSVSFEAGLLESLILNTQYAMGDALRPNLYGTLFEGSGSTLRMVAMDGQRLSKAEREFAGSALDFSIFVPGKCVQELLRFIRDEKADSLNGWMPVELEMSQENGVLFFCRKSRTLSVKLTDVKFPDYQKMLAKKTSQVLVPRESLLKALQRISQGKSGCIRLSLETNKLKLINANAKLSASSDEIDVDYTGKPIVFGFETAYLLDVLGVDEIKTTIEFGVLIENQILIEFSAANQPIIIRPIQNTEFISVIATRAA